MNPLSIDGFDPVEIGLPEHFAQFRQIQIEAVDWIVNSDKRFLGACLPTGAGKTLVAMAAAKALGWKTVVLTSTKGLQAQYLRDFAKAGLVEIKGKQNYDCVEIERDQERWPGKMENCRFGPYEGCEQAVKKGPGCPYYNARQKAERALVSVTNYAYWIRSPWGVGDKDDPNRVRLLVLDEAHESMEQLSGQLAVTMTESKLAHLMGAKRAQTWGRIGDDIEELGKQAAECIGLVADEIKDLRRRLRLERDKGRIKDRLYRLEEFQEDLLAIAMMDNKNWVVEMHLGTDNGRRWQFDCVWPGKRAEGKLFLGVDKVLLMSATMRPMTMGLLDIKKEDREFREWDRVFPAQNTPIYHVPTVKVNSKIDPDGVKRWVGRIDEIIKSRLDRKGIIHTVSYQRQRDLLSMSRYAEYMIVNSSSTEEGLGATEAMDRYTNASAPAILVSPSFATGWDFPGRQCEWQIISKVPFVDHRSKVMQARLEISPQYTAYLAMQQLVQAAGRGSRFEQDRCEVFVVDDCITFFMRQHKSLAPRWFKVNQVSYVPEAGKRAPEMVHISEIADWVG